MPAAHPLMWRVAAVIAFFMTVHLAAVKGMPAFWHAYATKFRLLAPAATIAPQALQRRELCGLRRTKSGGSHA
jgi:hypothetical protein